MGRAKGALEDLVMNRGFWAGRRVFVTGHTGFKGSWLLAMLRALGAETTGYALPPPTDPAMFNILGLADSCTHVIGDIRDLDALQSAISAARPEVVIHMAAQPLVRLSYDRPVETYAVNVMGSVHLMEACRHVSSVRSIVMVTTDKCYENVGWVYGYRETDRLGGADPYSNSKAACELTVEAYRHSFFHPGRHDDHRVGLASARAGNVIGGGDFAADRLVPDAVRAFAAGQNLSIRNPLAIRPWQHVLEPLSGYLLLAERLHGDVRFATGWNFGPRTDESVAVGQVADLAAAHWGEGACWEQDAGEHPHEAATLKLDSTKALLELGWRPQFTVPDAVDATMLWYRGWHEGADLAHLTDEQVGRYLESAASS